MFGHNQCAACGTKDVSEVYIPPSETAIVCNKGCDQIEDCKE